MKAAASKSSILPASLLGTLIAFLIPWLWSRQIFLQLGDPALVTGWWLFAVMLFLGAFNARKKLSMLPLGNASTWLALHVAGGFLTLALFWLHTGVLWPTGLYERVLAALFYALNCSGIVGWIMQRVYPRQLGDTGIEVIYERIPAEIAELREKAEGVVLNCTRATGSDTLARHYLETLHWFFRQPRFFANHALFGGKKARAWHRQQCGAVRLYLSESERSFLNLLTLLAERKTEVDFHYAAQTLMKRWLLLHVPLTAIVMLLVAWHILLIHIYAL
jgi:hypothetical protein